eukprot:gene9267-19235_t
MTFSVLKVPQFRRALVITILGAFFCFLPNFLFFKINDNKYDNSMELSPLRKTLSSTSFVVCESISMSVALPILFDFILDSFVYSAKDINPAKLVIWILLLTSIIPNIVTSFYVIPNMRIDLLILMPSCRTIPLLFSALWLLNTYGPSVWRWKLIEPVMLTHAISTVIFSFEPFVNDPESCILAIIGLPFYIIGGLIVTYMCLSWLYHLYTINKDFKAFTPDELMCTWIMFAFISLMISTSLIHYYVGDYLNVDAGLTGRYERSKVLLQHALHEAELKRSLADISLGLDSSVLSDVVENLLKSGDTTVEILNSLLTFDSLDQNIMELSMKQLSVTSLLIGVEEEVPSPLACITADEFYFSKVIQTLVSNATECTPMHGTVAINVSIVSSDTVGSGGFGYCLRPFRKMWRCRRKGKKASNTIPDGHYMLQIEVKDSGPGMTKEQEEEILTNPFSFTAGVLQTHQGQGLGLWISHRIVELHHGDLSVHSPGPCQGSTYIIRVPVFFAETKLHSDDLQRSLPTSVGGVMGLSLELELSTTGGVDHHRHRHRRPRRRSLSSPEKLQHNLIKLRSQVSFHSSSSHSENFHMPVLSCNGDSDIDKSGEIAVEYGQDVRRFSLIDSNVLNCHESFVDLDVDNPNPNQNQNQLSVNDAAVEMATPRSSSS